MVNNYIITKNKQTDKETTKKKKKKTQQKPNKQTNKKTPTNESKRDDLVVLYIPWLSGIRG